MDIAQWLTCELAEHSHFYPTSHKKKLAEAASEIPRASRGDENEAAEKMIYQIAVVTIASTCLAGKAKDACGEIVQGAKALLHARSCEAFDEPTATLNNLFRHALKLTGLCFDATSEADYRKVAIEGAVLVHDYEHYLGDKLTHGRASPYSAIGHARILLRGYEPQF